MKKKKNVSSDHIFEAEDYLNEIKYTKKDISKAKVDTEFDIPEDDSEEEYIDVVEDTVEEEEKSQNDYVENNHTADDHKDEIDHKALREQILNEVEETDNMKEISLTKEVLSNSNFRKYQLTLSLKDVLSLVQMELKGSNINVTAQDMDYVQFYNLYLDSRKELSPEERQRLAQDYYPSTVSSNSTGKGVDKLIRLDVPKEIISGTTGPNNKLFWTKSEDQLQKFTKTYPQYFGTGKFIPSQELLDQGYYVLYASTLATVLHTLGIDAKFLIEHSIDVKIATYTTKNALTQDVFYIIEFCKY